VTTSVDGPEPHRAPAARGARRLGLGAMLTLLVVSVSACTTKDLPRLGMPVSATDQGDRIIRLWQGAWIAAFGVGAIVLGLLLWSVVVYRKRDEEMPLQTRYNVPIEIFYTAVPLVVLAALFFFTARDESKLTSTSEHPDLTVNVVAYRWSWSFNYLDNNTYDIGSPAQLPTLWLPVGATVRFELTSPDVIHDFWVPAFIEKRDVIPGRINSYDLKLTRTGTFRGKCAELCGTYHSRMLFNVKVVTPEQFSAHMQDLQALGQTGKINGKVLTNVTNKQGRIAIGGKNP
jgi:cytochrome c oxidase subunit II